MLKFNLVITKKLKPAELLLLAIVQLVLAVGLKIAKNKNVQICKNPKYNKTLTEAQMSITGAKSSHYLNSGYKSLNYRNSS